MSTLASTWPATQVLSPDALRAAVSDEFSVKFHVLDSAAASGINLGDGC